MTEAPTRGSMNIQEYKSQTLSAVDVRAHVNLIQEVMQAVMKKDTHYGVIPGCKQPSLYKAGSEVLLTTFRVAVIPEVRDLSSADEIRYQVTAHGVHQASGIKIGAGIGECSSSEEKYKWRKCVCQEEFDATPENRRRTKWAKDYNGVYTIQQVRVEPSDMANTILKMAKKRAQIDLTLTALGASDIFTQDIEDLPEECREGMDDDPVKASPGAAAGKKALEAGNNEERATLIASLEETAKEGWPSLQTRWEALSEQDRKLVGIDFGRIKKLTSEVAA